MTKVLMNILWLCLGGWTTAVSWFSSTLLMIVSIVGIPWARASFNIALLNLWPFGSEIVSRPEKENDLGTGTLGMIGNIVWILFAGWWLALVHLFWMVVLGVTIIGIPFAIQHWKLAKLSLMPIGKKIVNPWFDDDPAKS